MSEFDPIKYKNDFAKEQYDRLNIVVPKGRKAAIKEHYEGKGYKSLNSYINALILADMPGAGDESASGGGNLATEDEQL